MNRGELEKRYRHVESQLNQLAVKKDNLESGLKEIKRELRRIDTNIVELTKELVFLISELTKK